MSIEARMYLRAALGLLAAFLIVGTVWALAVWL